MALRLPRLPTRFAIVDREGNPSIQFQQWWQTVANALETQEAAQDELLAAIVTAQDAADTANAAAAAATTAADNAQSAADATAAQNEILSSYPDGASITATDAGANVTVTVSGHDRVYLSSTLTVAGGSITGLPYSTFGYVYYIDGTRADTTPTYLWTTDETVAAQTGDTHLVGSVTTPAAAAPPSTGDNVRPPGVGAIP